MEATPSAWRSRAAPPSWANCPASNELKTWARSRSCGWRKGAILRKSSTRSQPARGSPHFPWSNLLFTTSLSASQARSRRRRQLNRTLLIAKRDYLQMVGTKAYLVGLVLLPLLFGGGFLVLPLANSGNAKNLRVA